MENEAAATTHSCSFCAKSEHDVLKLIAGPGSIFICGECVGLCATILVCDPVSVGAKDSRQWYITQEPPVDTKAMVKEIVRELREEGRDDRPSHD